MTRRGLADRYGNRKGKRSKYRGPSFDPDQPIAGHYLVRLRRGGPAVALQIWWGPPLDPQTGEPMDRAPRWLARFNGVQMVPIEDVWPGCAALTINQAEHDRIAALGRTLDRGSAFFDPLRPINRLTVPVPTWSPDHGQ